MIYSFIKYPCNDTIQINISKNNDRQFFIKKTNKKYNNEIKLLAFLFSCIRFIKRYVKKKVNKTLDIIEKNKKEMKLFMTQNVKRIIIQVIFLGAIYHTPINKQVFVFRRIV